MLDTLSQNTLVTLPSAFYATHGRPDATSEKYEAIPTYRIIHALEKEGFQVVYASQRRTRVKENNGYQLHAAKLRHKDAQALGAAIPEIALLNSSNGTSGFKLVSGAHVFACSNGLCFAQDNKGSFFVPHRGNGLTDRIIEAARSILSHAAFTTAMMQDWQSVPMPYFKQLDFAFHARALRFEPIVDNVSRETFWPVEAGDLLECRHYAQRENNLFNVFNRIQESLIRGGLKARGQNYKTRATKHIKGIEQDIKLNAALFELAKQYA